MDAQTKINGFLARSRGAWLRFHSHVFILTKDTMLEEKTEEEEVGSEGRKEREGGQEMK